MKKAISTALTLILSLSLLSGCRFRPRVRPGDSQSDLYPESAASPSASASADSVSSDSASSDSTPSDSSVREVLAERDDLAANGCAGSRAPQNYGTLAVTEVQSDFVSENSSLALKGTFNNVNAPVYNGTDIWTFAEFNLNRYYGDSVSLAAKTLQMDVYTENCGNVSSVIVVDAYGDFSAEIPFDNAAPFSAYDFYVRRLSNGWRRIFINFSELYPSYVLSDVSYILIMFSNVNSRYSDDSVFYLDNVQLGSAADFPDPATNLEVYNPDGYYSKDELLQIKIVGNSFIATSACYSWLDIICSINGASALIDYISIGYGRISDQTDAAFGSYGYMNYESPDVIFIQDFYGYNDVTDLAVFLGNLYIRSEETRRKTEVKIFPAENETEDGKRAARLYGLDLVDWKGLLETLKYDPGLGLEFPFGSANLNYDDGIMHSNELAGFFGGIMMYMSLYGENPLSEELLQLASDRIGYLIPGATETDKRTSLITAIACAAEIGLPPEP